LISPPDSFRLVKLFLLAFIDPKSVLEPYISTFPVMVLHIVILEL
jgi:hypothetical protein